MSTSATPEEWSADWASVTREQRRAWRQTSADERLRWLEDALAFARDAGALVADRERRAAAARAWTSQPSGGERDGAHPPDTSHYET